MGIMENQMEKKMENEMETGIIGWSLDYSSYGGYMGMICFSFEGPCEGNLAFGYVAVVNHVCPSHTRS